MSEEILKEYVSPVAIPPGETIAEILEESRMTKVELAKRMGRTPKFINDLIKGEAGISPITAFELERVFSIPASFWISREANYQSALARINNEQKIKAELSLAKYYPYFEMAKLGWLPITNNKIEKVRNLLNFFGVASLVNIIEKQRTTQVSCRISKTKHASQYSLWAWLRQGDVESEKIETKAFDRDLLMKNLSNIVKFSTAETKEFQASLVNELAGYGIALIVTPNLKHAPVNGATRWVSKDKALIQLSLRYKTWDSLWFTLFHEIGHIFLDTKKDIKVDFVNTDEKNIDKFAADNLIPPEDFTGFKSKENFSKEAIIDFANKLEIHPSLVLGRLRHDGIVDYKYHPELIRNLKWVNS